MRPAQEASDQPFRDHGFTVARLLVTMAVSGVMLAAAAPSFSHTLRAYSLRGAARELFAEIQKARMAAVMENNRYRFVLPDSHEYTTHDDDDNDGTVDGGERVVTKDIHSNSPSVTLAASGIIEFVSNGTAPFSATITLTNAFGDTMQVSVSPAGRIRIE